MRPRQAPQGRRIWPRTRVARRGSRTAAAAASPCVRGEPAFMTLPRPCLAASRARSLGPANILAVAGFQGRASG